MKISNAMGRILICALVLIFAAGAGIAQEKGKEAEKQNPDMPNIDVDKTDKLIPEDGGWRIRDFQPYVTSIRELEKLNKEYSENLLKLAIDEYSTGLDILEDMENEIVQIVEKNKNKKNLYERWYWQEIDRRNAEQRQIAAKKYEAKMKSTTYFHKAINYLDGVSNIEVKKHPKFINFQSRLYQVYVSTEYDLQNFKPCIPILERYLTLSEKNTKDVWAYIYMSSCYGYMEKVLMKYKHSNEDEIMQLRNKKNKSMLQAVEIMYGMESPHYKHMQETVQRDEKKSERINDFQ
jgi:hypothetical protein